MKRRSYLMALSALVGSLLFGEAALASTSYTVHSGDSLWKIAQKFGISLSNLLAANPQIQNRDLIHVGQVVTIPDKSQKHIVNWLAPTDGVYPKINKGDPLWIDVSITNQQVYIKKGDKTIYTMICSSGLDTKPENSTPRGTFYVEPERGGWFFAPRFREGAKYWVSWKNHGKFLFHSVPMNENGNVIIEEALKLGHKASHGCIRLSVPDAKWIFENIQTTTKVVIHD